MNQLNRRTFFCHSTKIGLTLAACAALAIASTSAAHAQNNTNAKQPLKVCVLSGCLTYNSQKSLDEFVPYLEKYYHVQCTWAKRKAVDDLDGLENLETCDVALIFFKRMQLRGKQLERLQNYALSGRPIVAVRTASHAVQSWLEFDSKVLGGNYHGHYSKGPVTRIKILDEAKNHPVLAGVNLTTAPGPLYKNSGHAKDINILMMGSIQDHTEPLAWTRPYKSGRVFYTSLGNVETFQEQGFRRLIANALFWAARTKPKKKE